MPQTDRLRESTMRYSIYDGALWSMMWAMGVWFLTPFAVAIESPLWIISALNSVPSLLEGTAQYMGSRLSSLGWERKKVFFWGVFLQAVCWLLLSIVALLAYFSFDWVMVNFLMVALAAAVYMFGGIADPPWFAIMGDVVPEEKRASWFGHRSRMLNIASFLGLIASGAFMDYMKLQPLLGFAALFFVAFALRLLGAYFVTLHWDPKPRSPQGASPGAAFRRFSIVIIVVMFVICLMSPYTPVFMLETLKFDYLQYSAVLVMQVLAYAVSYSHWGRLIERYGAKTVLVSVSGLNVLPAVLWAFVRTPLDAMLVTIPSGMLWAGTLIAALSYIYESARPNARVRARGISGFTSGFGMFLGGLAGGEILSLAGPLSITSFSMLFFSAAVLRGAAALLAHFGLSEPQAPKKHANPVSLMARIITIYPLKGLAYDFEEMKSKLRKSPLPKKAKIKT